MIFRIEDLQKLKKDSRLSYREIAERSGVPLGTVQKVLGGVTLSPRHDTLEKLSEVLAFGGGEDDRSVSYQAVIDRGLSGGGDQAVHETEYMYDEEDAQLDDRVERLLDSKKAGEFTVDDYYVISEKYRIELIDGEIYDMTAPVFDHQHIAGMIYYQMMGFKIANNEKCMPGIAPIDVQLDCDDKTMVQPDLIIFCDKKINHNKVIYGAPDFVLEVFSPSTRMKDRVKKSEKYRAAGCREYWMVDPLNERVMVLDFENGNNGIYSFDSKVPVRTSGGRCEIDFSTIKSDLEEFRSFD